MQEVDNTAILIHPETFEYPVTVEQFRERNKNLLFGDTIPVGVLNVYGYAVVTPTTPPEGDVVSELVPVEVDGQYPQRWAVRDYTETEYQEQLQELKTIAVVEAKQALTWTRHQGAPYDFGQEGEQHIQLREADISNLTGLGLKSDRMPERNFVFRTYENNVVPLTGVQMQAMTNFAFEKFEALMQSYWDVLSDIEASVQLDQVPVQAVIRQRINDSVK